MIIALQVIAGLVGIGIIVCMRNQQSKARAALAKGLKTED